jgi:Methyltransferase domain
VLNAEAQLTWSEGAMTPTGLAAVCADVAGRHRRRIVECGSAFSTLVLARLLHYAQRAPGLARARPDVRDAPAQQSRRRSARRDRAGRARAARAHPLARDGLQWYAQRALRSLPRRIDLLPGPTGHRRSSPEIELSRYPALPALAERLAPDATVVLDDIDRRGEQRTLEAWERDYGFRFELRSAERIAVGRRR